MNVENVLETERRAENEGARRGGGGGSSTGDTTKFIWKVDKQH